MTGDQKELITPLQIRNIALSLCPIIYQASFFTDELKKPVSSNGFFLQRNQLTFLWSVAGFDVIDCPRLGQFSDLHSALSMQREGARGTKETLDYRVIDAIHHALKFHDAHELHFILVCGDGDYINVVGSALKQGARVTILLTAPNAMLQPGFADGCEVITLYKEKDEKDGDVKPSIDPMLEYQHTLRVGTSSNIVELTGDSAGVIARMGTTIFICHVCQERLFGILEATRHRHILGSAAHISELPTVEEQQTRVHMLSTYGASEFISFVARNLQRNADPSQVMQLMALAPAFKWDVVDTALAFDAIARTTENGVPLSIADVPLDHFPLANIDALIRTGLVQEQNRKLVVQKTIRSNSDCYFFEILERLELCNIARHLEHGGLISRNDVRRRVKEIAHASEEAVQAFLADGITAMAALLQDSDLLPIEWNPYRLLYLLTARHADLLRMDIPKRAQEYWTENEAIQTWMQLLGIIAHDFESYEDLGNVANRIAIACDGFMSPDVLIILFGNGVLQLDATDHVQRIVTHPALRPFLQPDEPIRNVVPIVANVA